MAGISGALGWAAKNPVPVALGVFAIGAFVLLFMRKPVVVQDSGMGAFYAAQAAGNASGNELAMIQAQVGGAVAAARIAAERDLGLADKAGSFSIQANTIKAQTDTTLAAFNRDVLLNQELTRQQGQRQQYWLGVKQEQILDKISPYIMNQPNGPAIFETLSRGSVPYIPAR